MSAHVQPESPRSGIRSGADLTLGLLERVRLILRGGSVIDWYRLGLEDREDVRRFLRVNGYYPDDPADAARVRRLLAMASQYLQLELGLRAPESLWNPREIEDPFLVASDAAHPHQRSACILLKAVHTVNHLQARELRFALSVPELQVFLRVEQRVERALQRLQRDGFPIVRFESSRKSQASTITKLLSKRRSTAAQILDRMRFRVIVEDKNDLAPVLAEMTRRLVPFNYVVPEETTNGLLDFAHYARSLQQLRPYLGRLQFQLEMERADPLHPDFNECSADAFRMLNFVIDWPLRVRDILEQPANTHLSDLGHLIFVNVEFQMFDRDAWEANEANSAASHSAYKARQHERVRMRLLKGLEHDYTVD